MSSCLVAVRDSKGRSLSIKSDVELFFGTRADNFRLERAGGSSSVRLMHESGLWVALEDRKLSLGEVPVDLEFYVNLDKRECRTGLLPLGFAFPAEPLDRLGFLWSHCRGCIQGAKWELPKQPGVMRVLGARIRSLAPGSRQQTLLLGGGGHPEQGAGDLANALLPAYCRRRLSLRL